MPIAEAGFRTVAATENANSSTSAHEPKAMMMLPCSSLRTQFLRPARECDTKLITAPLLMLWKLMLGAGDTPFGRSLRAMIVDWPAAQLPRVTRGHLIFAFLLFIIEAAVFGLLESEGLQILSTATPEITGCASTLEIATLLDGFAVTVLAASGVQLKNVAAKVRALVRRRGRRSARTRA